MKVKELLESIGQFEDFEVTVNMGQKIEEQVYILSFDIDLDYSSVNMDTKEVNLGVRIKATTPLEDVQEKDTDEQSE